MMQQRFKYNKINICIFESAAFIDTMNKFSGRNNQNNIGRAKMFYINRRAKKWLFVFIMTTQVLKNIFFVVAVCGNWMFYTEKPLQLTIKVN